MNSNLCFKLKINIQNCTIVHFVQVQNTRLLFKILFVNPISNDVYIHYQKDNEWSLHYWWTSIILIVNVSSSRVFRFILLLCTQIRLLRTNVFTRIVNNSFSLLDERTESKNRRLHLNTLTRAWRVLPD